MRLHMASAGLGPIGPGATPAMRRPRLRLPGTAPPASPWRAARLIPRTGTENEAQVPLTGPTVLVPLQRRALR